MKDGSLTPSEAAACARFAELLELSGKTQEDLADAIGLSQNMISKMKRGERAITLDTAIDLAEQLNVPVHKISPEIQKKINSAYNSPTGGDLRAAIDVLQEMDSSELRLATDILRSVIKRRISELEL